MFHIVRDASQCFSSLIENCDHLSNYLLDTVDAFVFVIVMLYSDRVYLQINVELVSASCD